MYRCAPALVVAALALLFALPCVAQVQRNFPPNALRGELTVGEIPQVSVNGVAGLLSPGARIRGQTARGQGLAAWQDLGGRSARAGEHRFHHRDARAFAQ